MVQHEGDHSGGRESGDIGTGAEGQPGSHRAGGPAAGGQSSGVARSGYEPPGGEESHERAGAPARMAQLISGEHLLTVNPVDGSEIEPCPPGRLPGPPRKRSPKERPPTGRPGHSFSGAADVAGALPLLDRAEERERLSRLLARGRSVRLTAQRGVGRSVLLDAVAEDTTTLAPDGVLRLSGYHRTPDQVLRDLFAAVFDAPHVRPDRGQLLESLSSVGAVVLLDDIEFGGSALDELLAATPECAYLITATPDTPAALPESGLEEVHLSGLSRNSCSDLLEHAVRRPLTDEEADWAGDLWFTSEGQPLCFVQAGALLRQRDQRDGAAGGLPGAGARGSGGGIAALLAEGLSQPAREALRFALALGGVLPHHAHLPALVGDTHADDALAELTGSGLVTAVCGHYRLAAGAAAELIAAGHEDGAEDRVQSAAQHYGWWVGHPKVTAEQVGAETDAVLAAVRGAQRGGRPSAAVLLARTAAPALAAALRWEAWERVLRTGQEAARKAGEVAEEAYFHHELGILALCEGNPERARAELETSIGMRGVLADRRGTVAGRRALALVTDRLAAERDTASGGPAGGSSFGKGTRPGASSAALPGRAPGGGGRPTGTVPPFLAPGAPGAPAGPSEAETGVLPAVAASGAGPGSGPGTADTPPGGSGSGAVSGARAGTGPFPAPAEPGAALSGGAAHHDKDSPETGVLPVMPLGSGAQPGDGDETVLSRTVAPGGGGTGPKATHRLGRSARRNLMAAGAGAALAVVLGTVVAVSSVSDSEDAPADTVKPERSASQEEPESETPSSSSPSAEAETTPPPSSPPSESPAPGPTSSAPEPSESSSDASPSEEESSPDDDTSSPSDDGSTEGSADAGGTGDGGADDGGSDNGDPTGDPSGDPTGEPTGEPTGDPSGDPTGEPTGDPSGDPTGGDPTAGGETEGSTEGSTAGESMRVSNASPGGSAVGGTGG
ncbi:PT domain-containing protein [Streptomyces sp. N2-109]|uniref:PT domain-containing protein n=1 Tax=Streptomyces gossypii TaxID=2883101 RepID=A0ABT2JX11_9ACTN|nr:PT domain-containing protein [Streptomyces gossypii]MCT2592438.1 PT domain-containing protein [Streptomyces gossypii]